MHAALDRRAEQIAQLACSLDRTWRDRERLRGELETLDAQVAAAAEARIVQAEEQAARLREAATQYYRDTNARVQELLQTRDDLVEELGRLVSRSARLLQGRVA